MAIIVRHSPSAEFSLSTSTSYTLGIHLAEYALRFVKSKDHRTPTFQLHESILTTGMALERFAIAAQLPSVRGSGPYVAVCRHLDRLYGQEQGVRDGIISSYLLRVLREIDKGRGVLISGWMLLDLGA